MAGLDFPTVTHARLSNGVQLEYAQRTAVPITQVALSFDAGDAADPANRHGLQAMTLAMLDEGTSALNSQELAEAKESIGAQISTSGSLDRSTVYLSALTPNLAPSLALMGSIVKDPSFDAAELERVRTQTLTGIAQLKKDPNSIGSRILPALLYGANHPYAVVRGGDEAAVKSFSRADLVAFREKWLRPDNAKIYVVSDRPLSMLMPQLEREFGTWSAPASTKGTKVFGTIPARPTKARIVLVNRPQSPQSVILAGQVTPVDPRGDTEALGAANDVLGGKLPEPHQHGPARNQGLVLWRSRIGEPSGKSGALHHLRSGPGRPHRRFDRRAQRTAQELFWRTRASPPKNWSGPSPIASTDCRAGSRRRKRCSVR